MHQGAGLDIEFVIDERLLEVVLRGSGAKQPGPRGVVHCAGATRLAYDDRFLVDPARDYEVIGWAPGFRPETRLLRAADRRQPLHMEVLRLEPAGHARVRLQVDDAAGNTLPILYVALLDERGRTLRRERFSDAEDRIIEMDRLEPGSVRLRVWKGDESMLDVIRDFDAREANTDVHEIRLPPGARIEGTTRGGGRYGAVDIVRVSDGKRMIVHRNKAEFRTGSRVPFGTYYVRWRHGTRLVKQEVVQVTGTKNVSIVLDP
ncbi:MAG: hypothetical protein AAGD14_08390 [Planctomycetota bacterium]